MAAGFRKSLFGFNCADVMEYIEKSQKTFVKNEKDLTEQVEKLSKELELSNQNCAELNREKEEISKKLEEFNEKYEEIGRLSENIGKLYLVAQANARAIMENSEKNAGLAAIQVEKNLSTLADAHSSLDELKKNIVKTTDEFIGEVDGLLESLNRTREHIIGNTVSSDESKARFDEVYAEIVNS